MNKTTSIMFVLIGLISLSFQTVFALTYDPVMKMKEIPLIPMSITVQDKKPPEMKEPVNVLQEDFLKLKFGMFIHYNMATYKGLQWVAGYHSPADFNPGVESIDTDAWADAAVSAGMKYGVLTVKHVAGFCLWDSKYTTYDVMHPDCPYQKDLVAQFIKSFKSRGLKVGLYYCWRHPGFGDDKKYKVLPPECDPENHTQDEQMEFQKAQIAELLIRYPDVFYIWNDALDPEVIAADEILAHIKNIRPNTLVSANWWDWSKKGTPYVDIAVTETRHFPEGNRTPGETCWCLEQKWFWEKGFHSMGTDEIVPHLIMANNRNANFLLNVGPDQNGNIIPSSIKTLAEIGKLWDPNGTSDMVEWPCPLISIQH
jgi:alpha-L-fucosidase